MDHRVRKRNTVTGKIRGCKVVRVVERILPVPACNCFHGGSGLGIIPRHGTPPPRPPNLEAFVSTNFVCATPGVRAASYCGSPRQLTNLVVVLATLVWWKCGTRPTPAPLATRAEAAEPPPPPIPLDDVLEKINAVTLSSRP